MMAFQSSLIWNSKASVYMEVYGKAEYTLKFYLVNWFQFQIHDGLSPEKNDIDLEKQINR